MQHLFPEGILEFFVVLVSVDVKPFRFRVIALHARRTEQGSQAGKQAEEGWRDHNRA